jgi:hypothetical protein
MWDDEHRPPFLLRWDTFALPKKLEETWFYKMVPSDRKLEDVEDTIKDDEGIQSFSVLRNGDIENTLANGRNVGIEFFSLGRMDFYLVVMLPDAWPPEFRY